MLFTALLLIAAQPEELPVDDVIAEDTVVAEVRDPVTGELPVDPYEQSNANAGARQFSGTAMAEAFGGQAGIKRITDRLIELNRADPRIADIFVSHDMVRLQRTLFEQFCYILNAGCDYTGRDMKASHKDMGLQVDDLNALVENLQQAMREEGVSFAAQNRLLAKFTPMKRDVLER